MKEVGGFGSRILSREDYYVAGKAHEIEAPEIPPFAG